MMSSSHSSHDGSANHDNSTVAILLTLADTTWRIVIPTIALAGLGLFADLKLHTGPWLTLVGMVIGFGLAALLVRRQLRGIQ